MKNHYIEEIRQDTTEADRLRAQHEWLFQIFGFKIHPKIALPHSESELRIADIGTGTGIFLLDIANDLPPTAQLHGFDITDAHFPAQQVPKNVTFRQHDIRVPFAEEYLGTFDLVCVRLLLLGLKGKEWDLAANNLVALLKPGGYLQWIEPNHSNSQVLHNTPGAPATATREFSRIWNEWFRKTAPINGTHLSHYFRENDLEILAEDVYGTDHYEGWYHTPMHVKVVGGVITKPLVQNGSMTQKEADDLVMRAAEETKDGAVYQHSELYTVVGRKVLS